MNLKRYSLVHENDREYKVKHANGETFTVAKKGLDKATMNKITQHFATGGIVAGDDAPPATLADSIAQLKAEQDQEALPPATPNVNAGFSLDSPIGSNQPPKTIPVPTPEQSAALSGVVGGPRFNSPAPAPQTASFQPDAPIVAKPQKSAGTGGGLGDLERQSMNATKQAQESENNRAQAVKDKADEDARIVQQRIDEQAAATKPIDDQIQAAQARADQIREQIRTTNIDPGKLWNSRTMSQKATASIAMILGGIGSAITKQPNYAMKVIDDAIDRDIDAQKSNLGKMQTELGDYMKQGYDLRQSREMVKADMKDKFGALLEKNALQFQGTDAANVAQAHNADLTQQSVQTRMRIRDERTNNTLRNLQIEQYRKQLQMTQNLEAARAAIRGGQVKDANLIAQLPADDQKRIVRSPDGSFAYVAGEKQKELYDESMASTGNLREQLRQYAAVKDPRTLDRGTAESLYSGIVLEMNKLHDLKRITPLEFESFQKQVPDLSSFLQLPPTARQKLMQLGRDIDTKTQTMNRQYLLRNEGSGEAPKVIED